MSTSLSPVFSFWFGPLSWLERLSIQSFLDHGHTFDLYGYERPDGLPEGCNWHDATLVIPQEEMFFYKGGRTPATFSDLFRLMMMTRSAGIWVDCDMVCIRPFRDLPPHLYAYEVAPEAGKPGQINNAVLRLPPGSPLLKSLLEIFRTDGTALDPVWMPRYRRLEIAVRRALGQRLGLNDFQFGATGPHPLTYHARRLGLDAQALPIDVFYPLPYRKAQAQMEPGSSLDTYVTPRTLGVHLWRMALTERSRRATPPPPAPGSALAALLEKHGIEP